MRCAMPTLPTREAAATAGPWVRPSGVAPKAWKSWSAALARLDIGHEDAMDTWTWNDDFDAATESLILQRCPALLLATRRDQPCAPWGAWVMAGLASPRSEETLSAAMGTWEIAGGLPSALHECRTQVWVHPAHRQPGTAWEHWLAHRWPALLRIMPDMDSPIAQLCMASAMDRVHQEITWGLPAATPGQPVWWKCLHRSLDAEQWAFACRQVPALHAAWERDQLRSHAIHGAADPDPAVRL
jgi:hypothetical protein